MAAAKPVPKMKPKTKLAELLSGDPFNKPSVSFNTFNEIMIYSYRVGDTEMTNKAAAEIHKRAKIDAKFREEMAPTFALVCRNMWKYTTLPENVSRVPSASKSPTPTEIVKKPQKRSKSSTKVERVNPVTGEITDITDFQWGAVNMKPSKRNACPVIAIHATDSSFKWDPESLKTGLGGSEQAIVHGATELVMMGYRVYVYSKPPPGSAWSLPLSNPCYLDVGDRFTYPPEGIPDAVMLWRRYDARTTALNIKSMMRYRGIDTHMGDTYQIKKINPFTGAVNPVEKKNAIRGSPLETSPTTEEKKDDDECVACASEDKLELEGKVNMHLWLHDISTFNIADYDIKEFSGVFYLSKYHQEGYIKYTPKIIDVPSILSGNGIVVDTADVASRGLEVKSPVSPSVPRSPVSPSVPRSPGVEDLNAIHKSPSSKSVTEKDPSSKSVTEKDPSSKSGAEEKKDLPEEKKLFPPRDPLTFMYISNPSRGLKDLIDMWPEIRKEFPTATLKVAFGRETYGTMAKEHVDALFHKIGEMHDQGVTEVGKLGHDKLAELGRSTSYLIYPCTTIAETFCIILLESLYWGCECLVTRIGAMGETMHPECPSIPQISTEDDRKKFLELVIATVKDNLANPGALEVKRLKYHEYAKARTWRSVAEKWVAHMFPGLSK